VTPISVFAPAKLNLFLAITGRRADGFHDLVSLVVQLDFGDTLRVDPAADFSLECSQPDVPCDETNLILKAARAFQAATGWKGGARFRLEKRIPMGAGLGGGSSDAIAALRTLNQLANDILPPAKLADLAAQLGSDCPLFLQDRPVIMRGRGERITIVPPSGAARLRGRRVLLFKPDFGIATPWAYAQLVAAAPRSYLPAAEAEARLALWLDTPDATAEAVLYNNMESPAFAKYLALPTLLGQLQRDFELAPRMSGSGSACFAFLPEQTDPAPLVAAIRAAWGESAFVAEARVV
jgi:4-diphosphocytidyl-2-C-methyl-D-erythritol kinase